MLVKHRPLFFVAAVAASCGHSSARQTGQPDGDVTDTSIMATPDRAASDSQAPRADASGDVARDAAGDAAAAAGLTLSPQRTLPRPWETIRLADGAYTPEFRREASMWY